jgi:hypothetical protein
MKGRVIWCSATVVIVLSTVTAPAAHGVSADVTCPRQSNPGWDPYDLSSAVLAACDMTAYPLSSIQPLPGGGSEWVYQTPSGDTGVIVPPPSFDPKTASADQLSEYGIPAEPPTSDAVAHDAWAKMIAGMTQPAPPRTEIIESDAPQFKRDPLSYVTDGPYAGSATGGWVGYTDNESSGYFHYAWSDYIEPAQLSSRCGLDSAAVFWIGLGGVNNNDLGQAGTELGDESGGAQHAYWYETNVGAVVWPGPKATQGSDFAMDVSYNTSNDDYYYYYYNYGNGSYNTYTAHSTAYSGATTDFVAERLYNSNFTNFGEMAWDFAESAIQEYPLDHYPYWNWQLTSTGDSGGRILATANTSGAGATPSGVSGDGPFYIGMNSCN